MGEREYLGVKERVRERVIRVGKGERLALDQRSARERERVLRCEGAR